MKAIFNTNHNMKYKRFIATLHVLLFTINITNSQKDISTKGQASQSSNYLHYTANLAITGGPTNSYESESCSTTSPFNLHYSWWMLKFPSDLFITKVIIMYRFASEYRLAGYYLFVTNSTISSSATSPPDGHLCYHHEGPELPSINQTVDCYAVGKNIIIYNERKAGVPYPSRYSNISILELCDVQVYGCDKTLWGQNCHKSCPKNCIDQHCFPENSTCVLGCKNLTGGSSCNEYNIAWFSKATQNPPNESRPASLVIDGNHNYYSCAQTSSQQAWLQVDLGVVSVIKVIYIIFQPLEIAKNISGSHSLYLTNTSDSWTEKDLLYKAPNPNNNFPISIHQMSPPGFGQYVIYVPSAIDGTAYVDVCEVEILGCPVGYFGDTCNQTCPVHCNGNCDLSTGECTYGCEPGWNGTICNEECPTETFGSNCVYTCHCLTNTCDQTTGRCPNDDCAKGWMGINCNLECPEHRFGSNCNETCHCLYSTCDRYNGLCQSSKCQNGWQLQSCNRECDDYHYGEDCKYTCGKCRNGDKCDGHNGVCWNGCEDGWTGIQCLNMSVTTANSDGQSSSNNTIYAGLGTFFITILICVTVVFLIMRYRKVNDNATRRRESPNGRQLEERHYTDSFPHPGKEPPEYDEIKDIKQGNRNISQTSVAESIELETST